MAGAIGTRLPAEILHAILLRVHDGGFDYSPKQGLAACSLVCRHWAALIRPMLFGRLTLRSAEDVAQLLAFLRAPAVFGQLLKSLVRAVYLEEDQARRNVPWGHQFLHRLGTYLPVSPRSSTIWPAANVHAPD